MKRRRIMIVEDETILSEYLRDLLTRCGYAVTSIVPFGEKAAEKALQDRPDLILMDIKLRGEMDGIDAAGEIRQQLNVPIVFLTAYADETTLQRVKVTDAFGYVQKPFKEGNLRSAIEVGLYRHEMEGILREREQSYRILAENLPGIVYRRFPQEGNRLVFFNAMVKPMTGYEAAEISADGTSAVASLVLEEDLRPAGNEVLRSFNESSSFGIEYRIRHNDGSIRHFLERGTRIGHGDGSVCVDGMIFDITERRKMEEELADTYRKLERRKDYVESVLSGIESGIVVTDADMNVTLMNPYAQEFLGVAAESSTGPLLRFLPEINELLRQGIAAGETNLKSLSEDCVVGFSHSSMKDRAGAVTGHIVTFKDLSEVVKIRNRMRLKERLATMGEVVARVAHEMRNPLFGITAVAQILAMELEMTAPQKELMESLFTEARRLNHLVEELLDYTKEIKLNRQDIDLLPLLDECLGLNEVFIAGKGITVERVFPEKPLPISGDPERLKQVFLNIIKNAIDATPSGGSISVRAERSGSRVAVETADSGPGVPEEILDKIFDLFYTTKKNGTGLGLSISKKLVEVHGGSLIAANNMEKGATFTAFLPVDEPR
jgi:PAS domain S-box-containing protein